MEYLMLGCGWVFNVRVPNARKMQWPYSILIRVWVKF